MAEDTKPAEGQKDISKGKQARASDKTVTPAEPQKPLTFKVKLQDVDGKELISGFAYPFGSGYEHWSREDHGLEVEFSDLEMAHSFIKSAIETGALEVAPNSPIKLKQ